MSLGEDGFESGAWESGTRELLLPGNAGTGGRVRGVLGVLDGRVDDLSR